MFLFYTFVHNQQQTNQLFMKKTIIASTLALVFAGSAFAQPVSDRVVIPIAVTLNQILRIHVINGGNIEFVFNTIDDYKTGIANQPMYQTDIVIASSTDWSLDMGAETANWDGTDDPLNVGLFPSDNIGFTIASTGGFGGIGAANETQMGGFYSDADANANGLAAYSAPGAEQLLQPGALGNAGDVADNAFTISWECGLGLGTGANPTNGSTLLVQSLPPDRYVSNVLIDLVAQ